MNELPRPSSHELGLSAELARLIHQEIAAAGGAVPFSHFMERCLYAPGLGYYSAGGRKFGAGGDFVTAPEISPLFGRCLARSCGAVLQSLGGGDILEFGAGSGQLAIDLLGELECMGCLPDRYLVLERSAELKARQQEAIGRYLPQLLDKVSWIDALPGAGFCGVMLANEVLDAMSVERFQWDGAAAALFHVRSEGEGFAWQLQAGETSDVTACIEDCISGSNLCAGYISEFNTSLQPWLQTVAECLDQGLMLLIDYGYPQRELFHPQRSSGTLMCHYRQHAHADPLLWPGLQDITAHVNFTAIAAAAVAAALDVAGYTTQTYFLLDCGLEDFLLQSGPTDTIDYMKAAQQAKTLILPGEMGERFKCIGLTRGIDIPVPGFRLQDQRERL
ncbi:MAG: SAM-dependent methyltransferase [Gammaproteobacteria bacterium]|nr:SAM-dependent methyltransferase [Gammaproteobacteria bacterium]